MRKQMFVIFENLEEVHVNKDVGMIPYVLSKYYDFQVTILSLDNGCSFRDTDFLNYVNIKFFKTKKLMYLYILKNILNINFLMFFHDDKKRGLFYLICKLLNPKIFIYTKLDMDYLTALERLEKNKKDGIRKLLLKKLYNRLVDLFTVETFEVLDMVKNLPMYKNKIKYLPNGFYAEKEYDFEIPKEKLILVVGRLGAPPKNNHLLIKTLEKLNNLNDYKIYFIGPYTEEFKQDYDNLLNQKPFFKDKILLIGNVKDKNILYQYYKRANFLLMTSIYEGFSLVLVESMYFGCRVVSTDLSASYDVLKKCKKCNFIIKVNKKLIYQMKEKFFKNNIKSSFQGYIDSNYSTIKVSDWMSQSSDILAKKLENILYEDIDDHCYYCNAKNIYNNFNWIKIGNILAQYLRGDDYSTTIGNFTKSIKKNVKKHKS